MKLDIDLFRFFNFYSGAGGIFDYIFIFCAKYLPYAVILFILLNIWRKGAKFLDLTIRTFLPAIIGQVFIVRIIKELVERPRPYTALTGVIELINTNGYAFPSGHATFSFALALSVFYWDKRLGCYTLFLASLISIGRVVVGAHYPFDIVAGAFLGILLSYVANLWQPRLLR